MADSVKSMQINMRVHPAQRELIARAAKARHKTMTEFMVDAATAAAEDIILNQRVFLADEEQFEELLRIMDSPVSENAALLRTLATPAPWDK